MYNVGYLYSFHRFADRSDNLTPYHHIQDRAPQCQSLHLKTEQKNMISLIYLNEINNNINWSIYVIPWRHFDHLSVKLSRWIFIQLNLCLFR